MGRIVVKNEANVPMGTVELAPNVRGNISACTAGPFSVPMGTISHVVG
jgi:hypothetical protein